jgi:hypothetical protein
MKLGCGMRRFVATCYEADDRRRALVIQTPSLVSQLSVSLHLRHSRCRTIKPTSTTRSFARELKLRSDQITPLLAVLRVASNRSILCASKRKGKLGGRLLIMHHPLSTARMIIHTLSTRRQPPHRSLSCCTPADRAQACTQVHHRPSWLSQHQSQPKLHLQCSHHVCHTCPLRLLLLHLLRAHIRNLSHSRRHNNHSLINLKRSLPAKLDLRLLQRWALSVSLFRMMAAVSCRVIVD